MASLVVVFPAEPVTATTRLPHWRRTCAASDCRAMQRIFGDQQRHGQRGIGQGGHARARDHGGDGAALKRGGDKVVAVEPLAAHGKEELAGRDGARVDGVAGRDQRAGVGYAGRRLQHRAGADRRFCKCEIHCTSP